MMKIIVVGGGRRYSFVQRLKSAGFEVTAFELTKEVPVAKICDVQLASGDWKQDVEILNNMVDSLNAKVLPLTDAAAFHLGSLPACIGHSKFVADICYDKKKFESWMLWYFKDYYPHVSIKEDVDVIMKPRFGNSSNGIYTLPCNDFIHTNQQQVAQRLIIGTEYSVDTYFNRDSKCIGCVPRTRLRVAGGEVVDSRTENNKLLSELTEMIGVKLGMQGPACFQYMVPRDSTPKLFEINARFGGGNILSLEAGFDMIDMIVREYYHDIKVPDSSPKYIENTKWGLLMRRVNMETFF